MAWGMNIVFIPQFIWSMYFLKILTKLKYILLLIPKNSIIFKIMTCVQDYIWRITHFWWENKLKIFQNRGYLLYLYYKNSGLQNRIFQNWGWTEVVSSTCYALATPQFKFTFHINFLYCDLVTYRQRVVEILSSSLLGLSCLCPNIAACQ